MDPHIPSGVPEETWSLARAYSAVLGPIPSLFSSCVRAVGKVEAVLYPIENAAIRDLAVASADFLVRTSPTLKAVFYHASRELFENHTSPIDIEGLLEPFSPREIAAIIGVTYLYKRCSKLCPDDDWVRLGRKTRTHAALGYAIGRHMEFVGSGNGLLLGALRCIAVSAFAIRSPKEFKELRRRITSRTSNFDLALEESLFGCNHLQVSSMLAQGLGFCLPRSPLSMGLGMEALNIADEVLPSKIRSQLLSIKAVCAAIDRTHRTGAFCASTDDYQLVLPRAEEQDLQNEAREIIKSGGFTWLDKGATTLPTEISRALEQKPAGALED